MSVCYENDKGCAGNGEMIRVGCLGYNLFAQPCGKVADSGQAGDCGCDPDRLEEVIEKLRELEEKVNNIKPCECGENPGNEVTIQLSETSKNLTPGNVFQLIANVGPADLQDKSVTWSSSDQSIATVDQDGNVTAVAEGIVTITATTNVSGKIAHCSIAIVNELPVNQASYKRFLFEVGPHFHDGTGANAVVINEIEVYDADGNKVVLTIPQSPVYDTVTQGKPFYWDMSIWDRSKLTDGNWSYTTNGDGARTSCGLLHADTGMAAHWARFVGHVDKSSAVDKIRLYAGGNEGQTPQYVKVWQVLHDDVDRYVTNDRIVDNGLLLLATWTYTAQTTSGSYTDKTVQMV